MTRHPTQSSQQMRPTDGLQIAYKQAEDQL